ncbi:nucleoside-diphosphate sugar epimerase/dehydratase [Myxacorys almedinensis]
MVLKFAVITFALESLVLEIFNHSVDTYNFPRSLPLLDGLLSSTLIGGVRFSICVMERFHQQSRRSNGDSTLIIGAGSAGISLVKDIQRNQNWGGCPVAFIDDAPEKWNLCIRGIPVIGDRHKIPEAVRSLDIRKIVIAMPTAPGSAIREISAICRTTGVSTSTLPGIHEMLNGQVRVDSLREIQIEDLLRRESIQTNLNQVVRLLEGKRVLVTGAGGSIGSELCRQILKCHPAEIVLLGKGENSIFQIQEELERVVKTLYDADATQNGVPQVTVFISDIRTPSRLEYAFEQFRPDIIFHAAAHKHVPLMELNAPEAVTSNVLGTKNLLDMALRYNVEHFVMISTDKVVNPCSVMGASKRVAEMLVLQAARTSGKPYVAVRFGNVLGSRGSVIPTFKQQIASGGPLTITHPEIRRYFMTIPEAVQLVLQASILGIGGEVLMLDMGEPIKIVDLAEDLIRLSGCEVGKDIDIVFTGLRPGEKLFEELFIPGEKYERTKHHKILIVRNASCSLPSNLMPTVEVLREAAAKNDSASILFLLEQIVLGYTPDYSYAPIQPCGSGELEQNTRLPDFPKSEQKHIYPPVLSLGQRPQ